MNPAKRIEVIPRRGRQRRPPERTEIIMGRGRQTHYLVYCLGRQVAKILITPAGYELDAGRGRNSIFYGRIHGTFYPTIKAAIDDLNRFPCFHTMAPNDSRYGVSLNGVLQGTLELKNKKWVFRAEGGADHKKFGFMDELPLKSLDYAISVIVTSTFL